MSIFCVGFADGCLNGIFNEYTVVNGSLKCSDNALKLFDTSICLKGSTCGELIGGVGAAVFEGRCKPRIREYIVNAALLGSIAGLARLTSSVPIEDPRAHANIGPPFFIGEVLEGGEGFRRPIDVTRDHLGHVW